MSSLRTEYFVIDVNTPSGVVKPQNGYKRVDSVNLVGYTIIGIPQVSSSQSSTAYSTSTIPFMYLNMTFGGNMGTIYMPVGVPNQSSITSVTPQYGSLALDTSVAPFTSKWFGEKGPNLIGDRYLSGGNVDIDYISFSLLNPDLTVSGATRIVLTFEVYFLE